MLPCSALPKMHHVFNLPIPPFFLLVKNNIFNTFKSSTAHTLATPFFWLMKQWNLLPALGFVTLSRLLQLRQEEWVWFPYVLTNSVEGWCNIAVHIHGENWYLFFLFHTWLSSCNCRDAGAKAGRTGSYTFLVEVDRNAHLKWCLMSSSNYICFKCDPCLKEIWCSVALHIQGDSQCLPFSIYW